MLARKPLGVFVSGFVVYGLVAAANGAPLRSDPSLAALLDPVATARADSGSRLKAEYLAGDDGSKDYQLWSVPYLTPSSNLYSRPVPVYMDTMRNEECAFQVAGDGKTRCLPTNIYQTVQLAYSDAKCTQGMFIFPAPPQGCPTNLPKYVTTIDTGSPCPPASYYPQHVYPTGAFLGSNLPCYRKDPTTMQCGGCNGYPADSLFYAAGAEVDPTSFVGSTPKIDP